MSPSPISLWVKLYLSFMGSIMVGLISWGRRLSNRIREGAATSYLVELQRCPGRPPHPIVDDRDKVAHSTC